jgi:hypothetical protein
LFQEQRHEFWLAFELIEVFCLLQVLSRVVQLEEGYKLAEALLDQVSVRIERHQEQREYWECKLLVLVCLNSFFERLVEQGRFFVLPQQSVRQKQQHLVLLALVHDQRDGLLALFDEV